MLDVDDSTLAVTDHMKLSTERVASKISSSIINSGWAICSNETSSRFYTDREIPRQTNNQIIGKIKVRGLVCLARNK